jgi:hypothetical protein
MTTTTSRATGGFTIASWDEQPWAEVEGAPKLTHARVTSRYRGDLDGEGTSGSLMCYQGENASYGGYERIVGSLHGRLGSFVLRTGGSFRDGAATTTWTVVDGSATGALRGLRGEGGYVARHGEAEVAYHLDYTLDGPAEPS